MYLLTETSVVGNMRNKQVGEHVLTVMSLHSMATSHSATQFSIPITHMCVNDAQNAHYDTQIFAQGVTLMHNFSFVPTTTEEVLLHFIDCANN